MRFYDVKVRLKGDPLHEIIKADISAAEVAVIEQLHGATSVVLLTGRAGRKMDAADMVAHRNDLALQYSNGHDYPGARIVNELFGPQHLPLPETHARFEAAKTSRKKPDTVSNPLDS